MDILNAGFVKGFIRMCDDGFNLNWHERNGGNLSYRIKEDEIGEIKDSLAYDKPWQPIGTSVPGLAGTYFMVSGSGKYMRNMILDPKANACIIELDGAGENYRICWGLVDGGRPTSELMEQYDVAIWAHHGMFCSGEDFGLTFGLMHTVEKSAEILVKMLSMRPGRLQTITAGNFRDLARDFNVTLPEKFLYEK